MPTERSVLVRLRGDASSFNRTMLGARAAVRGLRDEIDTTNDRTTWMAQGILAIAPTLVPLGAAAVPILSGIATQLTVAAGAAGVLALGFNGVGDALGAVNDYQLKPTAENFEKLQQALAKIGPEGAEFVAFLDSIGPKFIELQMAAREGMFPGLTEGLEDVVDLLPQVEAIVTQIAEAIGELGADAGAGLSGSRFAEFFDYLETNAKPLLIEMGQTLGNFIDGFAAMIVNFGPLTDQFSGGLLNMSRSFADWAHGLDESSSFREFVRYVQDSIPMVLDFVGSFSDAFVALVQAAAPVGDVLLPLLARFLDVIGAIADTDFGPVIIGIAALASAYGRLVAFGTLASGGVFAPLTRGLKSSAKASGVAAKSMAKDAGTVGAVWATAGARTEREAKRAGAATRSLGKNFAGMAGQAARVGGPMAGVGLAMSGLTDDTNFSNTAMLGLMGTMGGPWGALAGATAGYVLDLAAANDDLTASLEAANSVMDTGAIEQMAAALATVRGELKRLDEEGSPDWLKAVPVAGAWASSAWDWVKGNEVEEGRRQLAGLRAEYNNTVGAARVLADAMGVNITGSSVEQFKALQDVLAAAGPTMDALGISVEQLKASFAVEELGLGDHWLFENIEGFQSMIDQIVAGADEGGAASDRMASEIAAAFEKGATAAERFEEAIARVNEILERRSTARDYEAAIDAASAALKENGKTLDITTEKGRANQAALDDIASSAISMAEGMKRADRKDFLKSARSDLADAAVAFGMNEDAAARLAKRLLTLDDTKAEPGVGLEDSEFRGKHATAVRRINALNALAANPLLDLNDKAFQRAFGLTKADLEWLDRKVATPRVTADAGQALSIFGQVRAWLNSLDGDVARVGIHTVRTYSGDGRSTAGGPQAADGTTVPKTGRPYADRHPYLLADGEEVISNRNGQADRNRSLLKAINAGRLADGGTAGRRRGPVFMPTLRTASLNELVRAMEDAALAGLSSWQKALDREGQQRLREAEKRQASLEKDLAAAKAVRDGWRQAMDSLADTVRGKIGTSDLFGEDATFESILEGLKNARAESSQYASAILALRRLGLTEDALAAFLQDASSQQAIDFSRSLSADQVAQLNAALNGLASTQQYTGDVGAFAAFGDREAAAAAEVRGLRKDLRESREHEKRLEDKLDQVTDKLGNVRKAAAEDGPDRFASAIKRESGNAARRNAQKARER